MVEARKAVARRAFEQAYARECAALAGEVRRRAIRIVEPSDMWALQELLTRERKMTDEKYDYRYSVLIFVFARLIREGWLSEEELEGLGEDKLTRIRLVLEL